MKHYINFGTAKTASTWVYDTLLTSFEIDYNKDKEPQLNLTTDRNKYLAYYDSINFAVNFNTNNWRLDSTQLDLLNSVSTHQSIILRNPYDYANSMYNFWKCNMSDDVFFDTFDIYFDYARILRRLTKSIKVLYYDDIVNDPCAVIDSLTEYLGINNVAPIPYKINVTHYTSQLIFNKNQISKFNIYIDKLQDTTEKDLTFWKKY
jgi:hypothetical protein